jgi:hypothetical protein
VEVTISQREVYAACLETGEVAATHRRSFAKHRTISDPRHLDALEALRLERHRRAGTRERPGELVERRDLARYDALIPA